MGPVCLISKGRFEEPYPQFCLGSEGFARSVSRRDKHFVATSGSDFLLTYAPPPIHQPGSPPEQRLAVGVLLSRREDCRTSCEAID